MRVTGSYTTSAVIDVDPIEVFKALRVEVLNGAGFHASCYLDEKNRIVRDEDYHTSHSWSETQVVVEKPSKEDIELFLAFKTIGQRLDLQRAIARHSNTRR
jgi:hypothetical protein